MTTYTTQTLVANVVYSGTDAFVSNVVPAANYYGGQGAIQTILYDLTNFQGLITVQATLNDLQDSAPWFDIATVGNVGNAITQVTSNTVIGNFTWIRAEITDFVAGNINVISASY
jgi:hypothetical protein